MDYIEEKAKEDEPFFLYFSMTSPHEPVAPSKEFKGKSGIAPIADFVMETDWSAGEIIKAIDEAGIAENTLVIFTADNGHSKYTGWEELVKAGHYPSGPFRGGKAVIWEGGHRVPFIVRWPGHVSAGSTNDQLLSLTDLFSTCAELVNKPLPPDAGEDSRSFLQALYDQVGLSRKDLSGEYPEIVESLTTLLEEQIKKGRSTPGIPQQNDTRINFRSFPKDRWVFVN